MSSEKDLAYETSPTEFRVSRNVILIRHAETEANAAQRWQGTTNAPFTARGDDQIARLGKRFASGPVRRLITSDLERAMRTAASLGDPIPDPGWREFHVGGWEGLTSDEVRLRFPGELERLFNGDDLAIGGGERMSEFRERVVEVFDRLVDSLDDGEDVVVVTHGGVIWAITRHVLGIDVGSTVVVPPHNTAVTRIVIDEEGRRQLSVFNDTAHLDELADRFGPGHTSVSLFRHGQTEGNVAGRWQGRSDSPLTEHGRWQAQRSLAHGGRLDALYTSPLGRTAATASVLGSHHGVEPMPHDGLVEMSFGMWENMTSEEAAEADRELFDAIYVAGDDRPRGTNGESYADAGRRLVHTVEALVGQGIGSSIGVVSHGAVIRAYITTLIGIGFAERNRVPVPRNTSMTRVVYREDAATLTAYNVAPHLDEA